MTPYETSLPSGKELAALTLGALALVVGVWYAASWFEARAFNSATGRNVSAIDAMFIELRVQEAAR